MFGILSSKPKNQGALPVKIKPERPKQPSSIQAASLVIQTQSLSPEDLHGYLYLVMSEPSEYRKEVLRSVNEIRRKPIPFQVKKSLMKQILNGIQETHCTMNCVLFKLPTIPVRTSSNWLKAFFVFQDGNREEYSVKRKAH